MRALLLIVVLSLTVIFVQTVPQNRDQQRNPTTSRTRGVDFVVQPVNDPDYVPPSSPRTPSASLQNCTCISYHLCDPRKQGTSNDNEVTSFGQINVLDKDCDDFLDVCCIDAAQQEESIVPKPIENVPTQEAGCGVRNVGGLDFELTGATVSRTVQRKILGDSFVKFFFGSSCFEYFIDASGSFCTIAPSVRVSPCLFHSAVRFEVF